MKRRYLILIVTLFSLTAALLVTVQIFQTNKIVNINENLFSISVGNAMDDMISDLNRMRVEDYIGKNDRYALLKFKRIQDLNAKMMTLTQGNESLFMDSTKVELDVITKDSAVIKETAKVTAEERELVIRYNQLLHNRNKLSNGYEFYNTFVNELSAYLIDNIIDNQQFNYALLDSMTVTKLQEYGIDMQPAIAVYSSHRDQFIYNSQNTDEKKLRQSAFRYSFHPDETSAANDYYIVLSFPSTLFFFNENMNLYAIVSIALIIFIIILFLLSTQIILNQRKLDEMKNNFISNMTHEIKTPIATISLAAEMLQDHTISSDQASRDNFLSIIGNENRRMQILVETILQSSKMSNKNFSLNRKEININQIVSQVSKSLKMNIESKGGDLQLNLDASPAMIYADELHFTNLVYNLIDNAIKYSPKKVNITVSTYCDNSNTILSVKDKGLGISKENQKHIFEKFYRVSTGDVHNVKGFGIGLNYVMQIVKLHGGTITVISELEQGSEFIVSIPRGTE